MHRSAVPDEKPGAAPDAAAAPADPERGRTVLEAVLRLRTFDALHHRDYRLLWLGQGCVSMAVWMDQVARGWLLYELTDSPLQLGLMRGFQAIPLLLLSPVAGTAADRYDRKLQVIVTQVLDALMYVVLAVLIFTGQVQPWHVYATAFLGGAVQVFHSPARMAMVSDAVPAHSLTNAIALSSVLFNLARTTGPALAGVLIAVVGTGGSYVAQAAFHLLATAWTVVLPAALRFPIGTEGHHHRQHSFIGSTVDGWKVSWNNEPVRAGMLITTTASLLIIPFGTLLPVLARDVLDVGAPGQGFLLTAMGVGAFCSAVAVASLGEGAQRGMLMLVGVMLYGISVVAFASSPWFPLSVALMVVVGSFHVSSHALVQTVIQTYSLPEFRGRAVGIFQQGHVFMTVGAMALGGLASVWGAQAAMGVMAAAGTLATFAIFLAMPNARRIR